MEKNDRTKFHLQTVTLESSDFNVMSHQMSSIESRTMRNWRMKSVEVDTTVARTEPRSRQPTELQASIPVQSTKNFLYHNSTMDSLSLAVSGAHPTWIVRRHPAKNDSTTKNNEPKFLTLESVKIEDWTAANVKRVEANRKLFKQIPYKSSMASAAFKETIEGFERFIGMQHGNSVIVKQKTSPNGQNWNNWNKNNIRNSGVRVKKVEHATKELIYPVEYCLNNTTRNFMEIEQQQRESRTRVISGYLGDQKGSVEQVDQEVTINEQIEPNNYRSCVVMNEVENKPPKRSYQTALILNVFEGRPVIVSSTATVNKVNFDESAIQKSTNLKIEKAEESDLSKNTLQKTLASYQQPILIRQLVKRPNNASELIGKQLMQKTLEEIYYPPDNEENDEKSEMHKNPLIEHPSTVTFPDEMLPYQWQSCEKTARKEESANEKNNLISDIKPKLLSYSRRPAETSTNVSLDMKQAPIVTRLSRKQEQEDDDFDMFEEESQPEWVTSSFRLGSVRRRKSEKNIAMQRIQKEIELEKQRHNEIVKMRRSD